MTLGRQGKTQGELMENRNGLLVDDRLARAAGVSEGLAAIDLADAHIRQGGTLAGDPMTRAWGFDTADFVAELRDRRITPHVAENANDTGPDGPGRRNGGPTSTGAQAGMPATPPARSTASVSSRSSPATVS